MTDIFGDTPFELLWGQVQGSMTDIFGDTPFELLWGVVYID